MLSSVTLLSDGVEGRPLKRIVVADTSVAGDLPCPYCMA
jgi:hypothetical protein